MIQQDLLGKVTHILLFLIYFTGKSTRKGVACKPNYVIRKFQGIGLQRVRGLSGTKLVPKILGVLDLTIVRSCMDYKGLGFPGADY